MKFREFLYEELTSNQKRIVNNWGETKAPVNISAHVIPKDQDRVVIPLKDPSEGNVEPHPAVKEHLDHHGYAVSDYQAGKAKDKYGRDVNIGKVLNKTNAEKHVVSAFLTDPNRSHKRLHDDMQVVISRHPHDVAGMSTGKDWTSCLDMKGGINKHLLPDELHQGTHVAYLTKKGDDVARAPLARIALKPYREEKTGRQVLVPEHKIYGNAAGSFEHTVNSWTNEHFPLKDNTFYTKNTKVYDDSNQPVIAKLHTMTDERIHHALQAQISAPSMEERNAHSNRITLVAKHGAPEQQDIILNHHHGKQFRAMIAQHGTDAHRDKLMGDDSDFVRRHVAEFGNDRHKAALLDDKSIQVRAAIARTSTNTDHLETLSNDRAKEVGLVATMRKLEVMRKSKAA